MNPVFKGTFNRRQYPSPRLGRYMEAFVQEMPVTSRPHDFVSEKTVEAFNSGCSLFATDMGGMRPWRIEESVKIRIAFEYQGEMAWVDVWQIDTIEPEGVLDALKYTGFYDDKTMDRFDAFESIALPLMTRYSGYVTSSSGGGVSVHLRTAPSASDWKLIADSVWEFNKRYFTCELSRTSHVRHWRKSTSLWFGHC
jgi:hypothetical protein